MRLAIALVFLCLLGMPGKEIAAAESKSPLGRTIKNFTLKDYRGKSHSLSDFKDEKFLVIAFLGTECPLVKLYAPRLRRLHEEFGKQGVAFMALNSNSQDSITEIAAYARIHEIKFPILKDLGNRVADQMGALRTPEIFVLDAQRIVRYWGRIDDQYGVGYIRDKPSRRDLRIALEELVAGKKVSKPTTEAVGCFIGRITKPKADAKVTYSNQIVRILQKRCVECHRKGEIAPFELTEYDEVAGWAETIEEVVRDARMPPWHASPKHGEFANDRSMSDEEKRLVYQWVADGAPKGDSKDLPEPRTFVTGWQLPRKPDLVLPLRDRPFDVPAEGTVRYQYFVIDPGFKEDKWIKAAEILPGNRAVVHHILAFARTPGQRRGGGAGGFLVGYVPGLRARPYPQGMAKRIPAGSKLVFQVHYTPIGTPQKDQSKIGFVFADAKEVKHEVITTSAVQRFLRIPPREDNHRVEAFSKRHDGEVLLLSMMPHMHLRGKSFLYEAIYADGRRETLLDVPRYDFNWQSSYRLSQPKRLPPGTQVHCVAHYDNSIDNLNNPDPDAAVRWGNQTWDEMMIGYFDVAVAVQSDKRGKQPAPVAKEDRAKARARKIFAQLDKNGDGKLLREEVPPRLIKTFDRLDRDGDKILTLDELARAFGARDR